MTVAAIYARRSTEQLVADDAKSVTRQIANARAFAVTRGWTVDEAHIYVDDGISGAEFERRPGFQRMLSLLPRPPFRVLIVSEQKSIGREMSETSYTIKRLAEAGVEVFEYVHGRSLTPRNAIDKVISNIQGFADEAHREQTSERVKEAHVRLTQAGHVAGGRVFGYTNRNVYRGEDAHGRPLKSHVERVINPIEAVVVQRIFMLYDAGYGLKKIAQLLTAEHAPAPTPFVRKDPTKVRPVNGWSPSTLRAVLARELYHGVMTWNRSRKRTLAWGKVDQTPRPEAEWMRVTVEHLRIVDEALWKRVASRRRDTEGRSLRFASGRLSGRPPKHGATNLLAGLATCACCGGGLIVETSPRARGRVPEYLCSRRRSNGTCTNSLRLPVDEVNEAILYAIEEHALTPAAIEQIVRLTERDEVAERRAGLEHEQAKLRKRIAVLTDLLADGNGDVAALVAKLRELEARDRTLTTDIVALRPVPRLEPGVINDRLAEWRRLLRSSTTQARAVLQRVLQGRIVFTPRANPISGEVDGYDFTAQTRFDKLFTGLTVARPAWIPTSTAGTAEIAATDTRDADYADLLEKANALGLASPSGFEPESRP